MSNLVFNPQMKDYFKAKACIAISRRYNYAGSCCTYRFPYLSFMTWSSSYRAAFSYVLGHLEGFLSKRNELSVHPETMNVLSLEEVFMGFCNGAYESETLVLSHLTPYFNNYSVVQSPAEKISFVYQLLEGLIRYNLGLIRYDLVSSMFDVKSAIRYVASKYFPDTPFIEIESDFMFTDVMD